MKVDEFIRKIPKAELSVHIEGTLHPELLYDLAKRNRLDLPFRSLEEVYNAYDFQGLEPFLKIYYTGLKVLQTEQDFYSLTITFVKAGSDHAPEGYLGIFHEDVAQVAQLEGEHSETALRESKGWPAQYGAVVLSCYKGSPAEASGLRQGDFVYKFDGADVLNSEDLDHLIATNPFATVVLSIYRDGERKQIRVKLEGA